jgi:hypothetical protein
MKGLASRLSQAFLPLILMAGVGACEKPDAKVEVRHAEEYDLDPRAVASARKSGSAPPVLVLLQPNIWNMVIGSDAPAFAMYADGRVIFREGDRYKSVQLAAVEQQELMRSLNIQDLSSLKGYYQASDRHHQTQTFLFVFSGTSPFYLSTYGSLTDSKTRSKLPDQVVAVYDRLLSFRHPRARHWLPNSVEVMIWPYEDAPDPSIVWPDDWPGLDSPTSIQRGKDKFSLYLPSGQLGRLEAFFATRHPKGAVEIGGKKWAASTRFPFPHERLWMAPETR